MGWINPGVTKKTKYQYIKTRTREPFVPKPKKRSSTESSRDSTPGSDRSVKRRMKEDKVYVTIRDKRRKLRPIEKLPSEILQSIFLLAENYSLPETSLPLTRKLASPYLYRVLTMSYFKKDMLPPARLLLSKFFTVDFFQVHIESLLNHEKLWYELPPEVMVERKLDLIRHLGTMSIIAFIESMDGENWEYHEYNDRLEGMVELGHTMRVLQFYKSRCGITPRKNLWEVLLQNAEPEMTAEFAKEFPRNLGFREDGKMWVQLAQLGEVGMDAIQYIMDVQTLLPPDLDVLRYIEKRK